MNQGLKSYTKQFTHEVSGVGTLSFNMCGAAKNMHMLIPLISTVGHNPINLSLIYNEQDKEVSGQFGKGFRLNLFKKLTQTSTGYEVQNADGSVDQYLTSNNYYNEETECSMMFSTDSQGVVHYGIKDRQKNKVNFANFQNDYPESYTNKYNQGIHISMNQGKLDVINNKQEDMIYFYYEGNTITLIYTFNTETTILRKTLLTLADDRITKIQYYEGASTLVGETEIIYELNAIKLKDVISGTITKVDFTTSGTYKVYDGYLNGSSYDYPQYERFQISYTSSKTTVTDAYGDTHTYYFDSNKLLYMEKNYKNEVKYCCFDKETKKLMVVDDIFLANNLASSLSFNITDGSIIGDQGSNVAQVVDDLLWNKLKYINRNGSQRQTLNVNVEPGDVLTFSFWLATYKSPSLNAVKIIVYVGDDSKEYYFKNKEIVELELHSLSYKVKEKLNTIQIEIVTTGTTPIRIGGFQLSTVLFRTNYVYSEHNLVEINNGKDTVQYEYEENGLDLKRTYFNGELVSQNEYNENGTLKRTTNEYGTKKELSYNSIFVNVQETQQKISSSNSVILETKRSFSEDGRYLTKIYNELGEYTKYEYDGLGRIEKAINALNEVLITTYNEGLLSALKLGSLTTNQYEYDERKRLKKVKTGTFSNYEFFYDYKNQITHIKMDGIVILTYTYDSYGNLTRQKYCETGDYYDFEYDNKNRVVGISVNGVSNYEFVYIDDLLVEINDGSRILKEYIYDEQNRLIKVEDNTNDLYMEINNVYNHDSKLTRKSMIVDNKTIHQSFNDFERSSDITFPSVDGVKTIGFVGTQLDIDGQNVMTKFDVYPLHHDANPVDKYKTKPFSLAYKNVGGQEQPKTPFIYDNESGRFVYCANYGTLSYKFGNSTSGTVMARVFKTSLNNEYLFGFIDANGDKIDVYLEASGYMWLFINGNRVVSTQMSFSVNTWHTVGLSYGKSENASSVDTTHTRYYRLFLDGTVKTYSVSSSVEYTTMKTCVGYKEGVSFPFTGYIEMLCFKNAYCEESTLDSLMMAIDTISTKSFIDEFQRINKKEVSKGAINVISNEFTYEKAVILSKTYGTHNVTI